MRYSYSTDEKLNRSTNKWMLIGVFLLVGIVAMFPLYRSYEPSSREGSREAQAASLAEEGETIWQLSCSSCHGLAGEGGSAPALNSKQFLQTASDDQAATLIAVGIPGSQMSAYSQDFGGTLTSEQIQAVVALIRSWESDAPDRPDWRDVVGG
ncbi:MAG: cytochrome c [Actinobacteria bacterium]|nr:cytochrome c [Actinomycetota bacterium]